MDIKNSIVAIGFNRAGFTAQSILELSVDGTPVRFVNLEDPINLNGAKGIVVPQGVFESFHTTENYNGVFVDVTTDEKLLLHYEREIYHLIRNGGWACFLIDKIIDRVSYGHSSNNVSGTDLCKRILNAIGVTDRNVERGSPYIDCKSDEFRPFLDKYGVAKTTFRLPYDSAGYQQIAVSGSRICAFEYNSCLFFIPWHLARTSEAEYRSLMELLSRGVIDYRQKHRIFLPEWLGTFQFEEESELRNEVKQLLSRKEILEQRLKTLHEYKGMLTTSGNALRDIIVSALDGFFKLKMNVREEFIEDFTILDNEGEPCVLCEVKGTKGGLKREHLNQLDSHRERRNLSADLPAVLFINNEMERQGFEDRLGTSLAEEQVKHAIKLRILVFRTIDFLYYMHQSEKTADRGDALIKIMKTEMGWLCASKDAYDIIK